MAELSRSAPSMAEPQLAEDAATAALNAACATITPTWPLDQAVAVNPHWRRIDKPLRDVAARLAILGRFRVLPARPYIIRLRQQERITQADLELALSQYRADELKGLDAKACHQVLHQRLNLPVLPLLIDLLDDPDKHRRRQTWRQSVTHQISQTCAAYFDRHQAHWQPIREQGFYGFWYQTLTNDRGVGVMTGIKNFAAALKKLPADRHQAERWALAKLGLPAALWADYLEALLLSINGWASWCAYVGREAEENQGSDSHLRELLAIRLAWEALLMEAAAADGKQEDALQLAFSELELSWNSIDERIEQTRNEFLVDEIWQVALEVGYQRTLANALRHSRLGHQRTPEVQAIFCIDVRSEPIRRALETVSITTETRAFAGFFGVPASYTPFASAVTRPQLPGLAFPSVAITDRVTECNSGDSVASDQSNQVADQRQRRLLARQQGLFAIHWPSTTFSFVEAAGLGYLPKIWHWLRAPRAKKADDDHAGMAHGKHKIRPWLSGLELADKLALAGGALRNMGIDQRMAPLILLVGHGSQSANNAHASTLDCGACGGQAGEANARALAHLLNEKSVREGLLAEGIKVPESTVFVAALHNTSTDDISGFDLDLLPSTAWSRWNKLQDKLALATTYVQRERAPELWINDKLANDQLANSFVRRANDGAQTRPEWGLTGNAGFIIGPRSYSRDKTLRRCYLHDYNAANDATGELLENLMMGPMLVTHWISWQYHASTCDPLHYGSGNKVLHNVVGGHLGVFEGNGGDLRIGMPLQSLFDGDEWRHEPLRLTVVIVAPAERIGAIIAKQPLLQQLVDNNWLLLWCVDQGKTQRYDQGQWHELSYH